ncbi:hypothetical protein GcC1_06970 [Golovinomyces cichoracearum]|uniref:Secreted effector protein n=1 Tax=Golovinomyces cichoracearum TaxID=62708 RepID=A0A420ISL5_9PEZI|nr:hypothetical protein GcC1_06970 [Golovinomyces cichoracearum]
MWPLRFFLLLSLIGSSFSIFPNQQHKSVILTGIEGTIKCSEKLWFTSREVNKSVLDSCQKLLENRGSAQFTKLKSIFKAKYQPVYRYSGHNFVEASDGSLLYKCRATPKQPNKFHGACKPQGIEKVASKSRIYKCLNS